MEFHEATPTRAVFMAGDIPIPIEPPPPIFGPTAGRPPLPVPPIPHIGNPLPSIVHGVEWAWDDVASTVSDLWHKATGILGDVASVTITDVNAIVDVALHYEQVAWVTFVGTLESWINASVAALEATIADLTTFTVTEVLNAWMGIISGTEALVQFTLGEVAGIDQALARQWWDTVRSIDDAVTNVEAWAIDNIAWPILQEISTEVQRIEREIGADVRALERDIAGLNVGDIAGLGAALAAIAATVATVTTWVEDCGAPMCEQMGPKTDWSKLLKVLNVAGMLALLTSFGTLTEAQLEQLATTVVGLGENPAETFVSMFVTEGDTLAHAIASTLPTLVP